MKLLKIFFVAALALAVLTSCGKSGSEDAAYAGEASISSESSLFTPTAEGGAVNFKSTGGSVQIDVNCGTEWRAEIDSGSEWLDMIYGNGFVTLLTGRNASETENTSTVTFLTASAGAVFARVYVTQNGYGSPEVSVEADYWHFPAVGELTVEIAVESSLDYVMESDAYWLTGEKGDGTVILHAVENFEVEGRTAGLVLTCSDGVSSDTAVITVVQDGRANVSTNPERVVLGDGGDCVSVVVEANYEWGFSYNESNGWFEVRATETGLEVTATADCEGESRNDVVVITCGDGAENVAEAQLSVVQSSVSQRSLVITYRVSRNTEITLPLDGSVDCTVDWGDGNVEAVSGSFPSHPYSGAGEYDVAVTGTVTSLDSNDIDTNSSECVTAVRQWGLTGLTSMYRAFTNCTNLETIPTDEIGSFADVTDFKMAFCYCNNLLEIPKGMLDYASKVVTFQSFCYQAYALKTIPEGLFDACSQVTSYQAAFYCCKALESIPAGLFDNSPLVTTFQSTFYWCETLTSIPAGLFDHNPLVTSFYSTFNMCSKIEYIPEHLFDNCPLVTTFANTFRYCYIIGMGEQFIPDGFFDNCPLVTSFEQCFYYCSIGGIPAGLFDNCPLVESFKWTFGYCDYITEIPAGLFDHCPLVTDFSFCFYDDWLVQSIPDGLFDNCPDVETFQDTFAIVELLQSVPAGLFDNQKNVKSFDQTFYYCVNLKGESPYTVVDGKKVHLYERSAENGFEKPTGSQCFYYCFNMDDYAEANAVGWTR